MAEYLSPGVYVEETSFRGKSIAAVSTSVAAVAGPTRTGPLRGTPEPVTSYPEFVRRYGDEEPLVFGTVEQPNYTALAARAFFDNGGKQLFVSRVINGLRQARPDGSGTSAVRASAAQGDLTFRARFPGNFGNCWLEFTDRPGENATVEPRGEVRTLPADGRGYLRAEGLVAEDVRADAPLRGQAERFPITVTGAVRVSGDGDHYFLDSIAAAHDVDGTPIALAEFTPPGANAGFARPSMDAELAAAPARIVRFFTNAVALGSTGTALHDGTLGLMRVPPDTDFPTLFTAADGAPIPAVPAGFDGGMWGVFHGDGTRFRVSGELSELDNNVDVDMFAFLGLPEANRQVRRQSFDVDVRVPDADGRIVYTYGDVSITLNEADPRRLLRVLAEMPERREARDTSPIAATWGGDDDPVVANSLLLAEALFDHFEQHPDFADPPPRSFRDPRLMVRLQGGTDGAELAPVDYRGDVDEVLGSTGFSALEDVEDISIVMTPAAAAYTPDNHFGVIQNLLAHCLRMRYRVGIVDARQGMSIGEVRDLRASIGDESRLALYYPWVEISNPTRSRTVQPTMTVPPSGFIAGIYARTDVDRGVHKAPANVKVIGALRFAQDINRFQQELLNPQGINCLRFVDRRGYVVWGGRTLSTDVEWQYVNVRRYFLFLERSIDTSTTWAVFEPNGPRLWDNVRSAVEDFLYNEWFNGHLYGRSPAEAYFVRCDESTMTQNDIDNGRMVCLVGVTPLRPAEFVIFRVGQKTADA